MKPKIGKPIVPQRKYHIFNIRPRLSLQDEEDSFGSFTRLILPRRMLRASHAKQTAYLAREIRNKRIDFLRRRQFERKMFLPLDPEGPQMEPSEEPNRRIPPSSPDNSGQITEQAEYRQALLELPIQLAIMVHALPSVNGNISKLARLLRQPQRKTARQVDRIRKHFLEKGLGS